jgi:flagellar biosynthesis GTPase FlhF
MKKKCSVQDCCADAVKNGFCNKHNLRFKRHGDPLFVSRRPPNTATDEDRRIQKNEEYQRNREKYLARNEEYRKNNKEKAEADKRKYLDREEVKVAARKRSKDWKEKNPEKKKQMDKDWRANNVDKKRSYQAFRRAKVKEATPPWLTKEHRYQIALIYKEALRLSKETGVMYHVDHIVPLAGREVSGLHVPWNLQAIPAVDNHRKSNKLEFT